MSIKIRRNLFTPQNSDIQTGFKKLQQTIHASQHARCSDHCRCQLCLSYQVKIDKTKSSFNDGSYNSDKWIFQVLIGLTISGARSLKLFVPDICFIDGDLLHIFFTQNKDNRICKLPGCIPIKSLYNIMIKLKRQYKEKQQQNFQKIMIDQVDPQYMHQKYLEKLLPSYFHDGQNSKILFDNVSKFRSYILHKNKNYTINSIQQHKINQNQPFCMVRYKDSNYQLFSKHEFQTFTALSKIPNDIVYVQAYIKQKQQAQAIYTSSYTQLSKDLDLQLFQKAQLYILVLIQGIGKYSPQYKPRQVLQQIIMQLMIQDVPKYCKIMTYIIVHYLAMASKIYIKHIKINWVLNDMEVVYLHNIIEFQKSQLSKRQLRYQLPPRQDGMKFYKDANNFITIYKQMKVLRDYKKNTIQKQLKQQKLEQIKKQTCQLKEVKIKSGKNSLKIPKLDNLKSQEVSKTIDLSTMSARNTRYQRQKGENFFERKKKQRYGNSTSFQKQKKQKQSTLRSFRKGLKFDKIEEKRFSFLSKYDF